MHALRSRLQCSWHERAGNLRLICHNTTLVFFPPASPQPPFITLRYCGRYAELCSTDGFYFGIVAARQCSMNRARVLFLVGCKNIYIYNRRKKELYHCNQSTERQLGVGVVWMARAVAVQFGRALTPRTADVQPPALFVRLFYAKQEKGRKIK